MGLPFEVTQICTSFLASTHPRNPSGPRVGVRIWCALPLLIPQPLYAQFCAPGVGGGATRWVTSWSGKRFLPASHCMAQKWSLGWHGGIAEQHMGLGKQQRGWATSSSVPGWLFGWVCNCLHQQSHGTWKTFFSDLQPPNSPSSPVDLLQHTS